MITDAIGLSVTTIGCVAFSFFASDVVVAATKTEPNVYLDWIYNMTVALVPVLVAWIWSRRKKRKDGQE